MTSALDGIVRDGRHHMQIRVYYEDTDLHGFPCVGNIGTRKPLCLNDFLRGSVRRK